VGRERENIKINERFKLDMIKKNRDRFSEGVAHSFTGSKEESLQLVESGLYIGINGCSLKSAENIEAMMAIPLERLMIETDAPWCGIKPTHAGYSMIKTQFESVKKEKHNITSCIKDRNEPCYLLQVLEVVAAYREMDVNELAEIAYENTQRVFFKHLV